MILLQRFLEIYKIKYIYRNGSDFSVVIVNCLLAIICKKIDSSSTKLLPKFSGLDFSSWQDYIQSTGSIKELWPS